MMLDMFSRWRLRTQAMAVAAGCASASAGAVIAAVLSGEVGFWILAGAALLAGSGFLAPVLADALSNVATDRKALEAIRDKRPVELTGADRQVAVLLDPRIGVVPFTGRGDEESRLLAWCTGNGEGSVRLVTGGGGVGKTRLALRLAQDLTEMGWSCEWIRDGAEASAVEAIRKVHRGRVLIVVDYAETRLGLASMLSAVSADRGGAMRVLLLARQAGDWWQRLEAVPTVRAMIVDAKRFHEELRDQIDADVIDIEVVRHAMPFFADRLQIPCPDVNSVELKGQLRTARVLDLHAAAIVAILAVHQQGTEITISIDLTKVLEELLGHEMHYWYGRAMELDILSGPLGVTERQLGQIVAVATLLGASTHDDVTHLIGRVPEIKPSVKLASWLQELYPPSYDEGRLGSLRPDRLAELHVTRELTASKALAQASLTELDHQQARRALILLARASSEHPAARRLLEPTLFRFSQVLPGITASRDTLIAIAGVIPSPSIALAAPHAEIVARIIATLTPGQPGRATWLVQSAVLLSSLGRREEALAASDEAVATLRELASSRPGEFLPHLAAALDNQAGRLREFARSEEALASSEQAVAVHRRLAASEETVAAFGEPGATHSDTFLQFLATSLCNQSVLLSELGRQEEALATSHEAVNIGRQLAVARRDAFLPHLAAALDNQAGRLSELGRREEALATSEEAVAAFRELASTRPDAFLPNLATALSNQAVLLSELGRPEEALAASDEAVAAFRELAAAQPQVFLPDLATALTSQSNRLSDLRRWEEALTISEEAVAAFREVAATRPLVMMPGLARALNSHSSRLSDLGRWEEALAVSEEAVAAFRELVASRPDACLPDLVKALNDQADYMSELGQQEEMLIVIYEAVAIGRELAAARPQVFLPDLVKSLSYQAVFLSELGRWEEALASEEEAIAAYRELAAARPQVFLPDLAKSLSNQAVFLSELGRWEEALPINEEAIAAFRKLASTRQPTSLAELAEALWIHTEYTSKLERWEETLGANEEAVAIFRELAAARPQVFLPDLAKSLSNQAVFLSELGRWQEALSVNEEAVAAFRELVAPERGVFLSDFAASLKNLATVLSFLGRTDEANLARTEADSIRRHET